MKKYRYITLMEKPMIKNLAAEWFHSKWGIPKEEYMEYMNAYLNKETEYGWYLCLDGEKIVAGLGVIEMIFITEKILRQMYVLFIQKKNTAVKELLGIY